MKLPKVDFGSQCMECGRFTEPKYLMMVVVHPGRLFKGRRFLQPWCVECIAAAKPQDAKPAPSIGELSKDGKLLDAFQKVSVAQYNPKPKGKNVIKIVGG